MEAPKGTNQAEFSSSTSSKRLAVERAALCMMVGGSVSLAGSSPVQRSDRIQILEPFGVESQFASVRQRHQRLPDNVRKHFPRA